MRNFLSFLTWILECQKVKSKQFWICLHLQNMFKNYILTLYEANLMIINRFQFVFFGGSILTLSCFSTLLDWLSSCQFFIRLNSFIHENNTSHDRKYRNLTLFSFSCLLFYKWQEQNENKVALKFFSLCHGNAKETKKTEMLPF